MAYRLLILQAMFCLTVLYPVDNLSAQTLEWEDFLEQLTAGDDSGFSVDSERYDELCDLHENPINLNTATPEELSRLPFLTAEQIEELLAYVYSYGPMKDLGELNLIRVMDYETRRMLPFFVYCGPVEKKRKFPLLKNIGKYGRHEVLVRTDVPLYRRAAYRHYSDSVLKKSPNKVYWGSPLYHSLRYQFRYGQRVEAGLVAEKDAGEPFFNSVNKGFDSYAGYLVLRDLGVLKTLALGHYKLSYGQGLVLNTGFSMGKLSALSRLGSMSAGIRKHSSTSETDYFQGLAAAIQWGRMEISGFYSYRNIDATLYQDSLISSLKTDGYHRTKLEISKRYNTVNQLIGSHLAWKAKGFHIGFTTLWTVFNRSFRTPASDYQRYNPQGNEFGNLSVDYAYYSRHLSLSGETAYSGRNGWATLNMLSWQPTDGMQWMAVFRHYTPQYNALFGSAFSEGGSVKNENGIYVGTAIRLVPFLKLTAYADLFRFPWLKYQVSQPNSKGIDLMGQLQYEPSDNFSALLKYRCKVRQKDYKDPDSEQKALANNVQQTVRMQLNYALGKVWSFRTQADYTQLNIADGAADRGYALSQQLIYKCAKPALQCTLSGVYFHTDDYASRVYAYERGLLYTFSFSSYYYHGYRMSAVVRYDVKKWLMLLLKFGHTQYFDRNTIGSAQDQINSCRKQDIQLQVRVKF